MARGAASQPGQAGGAAVLPHPSCTRRPGWPPTAAPDTPCRRGKDIRGRPWRGTLVLWEGTREPQSHPEVPPGSPGRWQQAPGHTRLATNILSLMSQTPRWDRAAPEAELGGLRGWRACRCTLMHTLTCTHTVTRTHVHGPDTISHYPGLQCHQVMHRLELATSGWEACDREGTEGRPLLHFLTHNCPPAPLLQGEPRGWATEQLPVVTPGCAGPVSQGLGAHTPVDVGGMESMGLNWSQRSRP